jgi:hypothetical protein
LEYQYVANPDGGLPVFKHGVKHVLETIDHPVTYKFRRLDPMKLQAAKAEFLKMEIKGGDSPVLQLLGKSFAHCP